MKRTLAVLIAADLAALSILGERGSHADLEA
jgi:hypothetical protein